MHHKIVLVLIVICIPISFSCKSKVQKEMLKTTTTTTTTTTSATTPSTGLSNEEKKEILHDRIVTIQVAGIATFFIVAFVVIFSLYCHHLRQRMLDARQSQPEMIRLDAFPTNELPSALRN